MTAETAAKRKALSELSRALSALYVEMEEDFSINELLLEHYNPTGELTFHTFHDWKKEGYKVKKGEKAFLIWGRPPEKKQNEPEPQNLPEGEKGKKFFPLAYLFSDKQVEPLKNN